MRYADEQLYRKRLYTGKFEIDSNDYSLIFIFAFKVSLKTQSNSRFLKIDFEPSGKNSNKKMYKGKKVIAVLPAYNASLTLEKTYNEIPTDLVDEVILCDDASSDNTADLAHQIGINHVIKHEKNKGYGGNQKSLYNKALELGGDIIIMLHPDYQYTPKLIPAMVNIIGDDLYPVVLGSRILGKGALNTFDPSERNISCVTFSISDDGLKRIKSKVDSFRNEILNIVRSDEGENRVAQFNVQFFPVSDKKRVK